MAYSINDGATLQITSWGSLQGSYILNVFHYRLNRPAGITDGQTEVFLVLDKWVDDVWKPAAGVKWKDWVTDQFTLMFVRAQIVHAQRQPYEQRLVAETGSVALPSVPSNVGLTVSLQASRVGKGRTGSKHFTGFPKSLITGSTLDAGLVADAESTAAKFTTSIPCFEAGGGTWQFRIWNQRTPNDTSEVMGFWCQLESRIMRRRTFRVGI